MSKYRNRTIKVGLTFDDLVEYGIVTLRCEGRQEKIYGRGSDARPYRFVYKGCDVVICFSENGKPREEHFAIKHPKKKRVLRVYPGQILVIDDMDAMSVADAGAFNAEYERLSYDINVDEPSRSFLSKDQVAAIRSLLGEYADEGCADKVGGILLTHMTVDGE